MMTFANYLFSLYLLFFPQVRIPGPGGIAPAGGAPITFVQGVGNANSAGTTLTTTISPTAGNHLRVGVYLDDGAQTIISVKLSDATTSLTVQTNCTPVSGGRRMAFAYVNNVPSGITGVVLTTSAAVGRFMGVVEYSGGVASSPADQVDGTCTYNNATGTTWTANAITPTAGINEVMLAFAVDRNAGGHLTCTASGYTRRVDYLNGSFFAAALCENIQTTTSGSYTAAGGNPNNEATVADAASYK